MSTLVCLAVWFVFVVAVIVGIGIVGLFSHAQRWEQQGERGER
jgi:hypothetical protein